MKTNSISRRNFIKISAVAGSMLVGGKLLFDLAADKIVTVKEARTLMGTVINLSVVAESRAAGEAAVESTFAELTRQVEIFNHRDPESAITTLNRTGKLLNPPKELVEVLVLANQVSEMTGGAFDASIKPLVDLYQGSQPALPGDDTLASVLALVGYNQLSISKEEIAFKQPGMAITLDGIAKGYIVDAGTAVLKDLGYKNVYVEAGGDLMASGVKEGDVPWKIGIKSPRDSESGVMDKLNVSDQAVATSGDYFQYYSADMRHHHIIDPRIGYSDPGLASVTVVSGKATLSDALATGVMVLGAEQGMRLIDSIPGVEGYLITKNLAVVKSSDFPTA